MRRHTQPMERAGETGQGRPARIGAKDYTGHQVFSSAAAANPVHECVESWCLGEGKAQCKHTPKKKKWRKINTYPLHRGRVSAGVLSRALPSWREGSGGGSKEAIRIPIEKLFMGEHSSEHAQLKSIPAHALLNTKKGCLTPTNVLSGPDWTQWGLGTHL